jgi:hypothetical protein
MAWARYIANPEGRDKCVARAAAMRIHVALELALRL